MKDLFFNKFVVGAEHVDDFVHIEFLTDIFDIRKMPIYSEQHFFSSSLAFSFSLGDFLDIIILAFSIILDFYARKSISFPSLS